MPTFSDYAREVSRIEQQRGQTAAEAQREKAQLWGSTLASLGQLPLQIMQQRQSDRQAQAQAERQAKRDALEEGRFGLDVAKFQADQAEMQRKAAGQLSDPEIDAALKQANGHYPTAAAILRESNPGKAEQFELQNLETLDKVLKQSSAGNWAATRPILLRRAPNPEAIPETFDPKWKEQQIGMAPEPVKTREIKTRNPDGSETIQLVPDTPGQSFDSAAAVPSAAANPNEWSVLLAAAGGDPNKALALQRRQQASSGSEKERIVQIMGPNGTPIWVRESQAVGQPAAQAPRAVTGQERQSLSYYNRAKDAVDTITNPGQDALSLEDRVAKSGLGTQLGLQYAPNLLQTKDQQAYRQAQRAFTEARLRKESGAAIPNQEYENDAKTYFAQPGDKPSTVEQKRKARSVVLTGLKFSSGRAYDEFYGESNTTPQVAPPTGRYNPATGKVE